MDRDLYLHGRKNCSTDAKVRMPLGRYVFQQQFGSLMKIYDSNMGGVPASGTQRTQETQQTDRTGSSGKIGSGGGGDRVEFSGTLGQLSRAVSAFQSDRSSRVQAPATQYQGELPGQFRGDRRSHDFRSAQRRSRSRIPVIMSRAVAVIEQLASTRMQLEAACALLLLSPTPDSVEHCSTSAGSGGKPHGSVSGPRSPRRREIPGPIQEAWKVRRRLRTRASRLLENAARFHQNWQAVRGALTGLHLFAACPRPSGTTAGLSRRHERVQSPGSSTIAAGTRKPHRPCA